MDDLLIEKIVEEVLKRLKEGKVKTDRILVIFTGSFTGLNTVLAQLKVLKNKYRLEAIYSEMAKKLGIPKKVLEDTGIKETTDYCLKDVKKILIPVLTQNTAAKIAGAVNDNPMLNLIFDGLMRGIQVVAVRNGADPWDENRKEMGWNHMPPALAKKLEDNLSVLESYGIRLVDAEKLAGVVLEEDQGYKRSIGKEDKGELYFQGKVFTAAELDKYEQGAVIRIKENTLITPLARDKAREYKIVFEQIK
ncbi:MAG: hypothetical protein GXW85_10965 [Clostridia bacterium]|nr:hypothetical protein [Clostridia bacterium]